MRAVIICKCSILWFSFGWRASKFSCDVNYVNHPSTNQWRLKPLVAFRTVCITCAEHWRHLLLCIMEYVFKSLLIRFTCVRHDVPTQILWLVCTQFACGIEKKTVFSALNWFENRNDRLPAQLNMLLANDWRQWQQSTRTIKKIPARFVRRPSVDGLMTAKNFVRIEHRTLQLLSKHIDWIKRKVHMCEWQSGIVKPFSVYAFGI